MSTKFTEIRLYIEGGGNTASEKNDLKIGFRKFFDTLIQSARQQKLKWEIIMCGSNLKTIEAVRLAANSHPTALNILLIDSDGEVSKDQTNKAYLRNKFEQEGDKKTSQAILDLNEEQCYLMVQEMEAWFLADRQVVEHYFRGNFYGNKVPANSKVEDIDKANLVPSLENATRRDPKKQYNKIRDAKYLLEQIDPAKVRKAAPHCDELFKALEKIIEEA